MIVAVVSNSILRNGEGEVGSGRRRDFSLRLSVGGQFLRYIIYCASLSTRKTTQHHFWCVLLLLPLYFLQRSLIGSTLINDTHRTSLMGVYIFILKAHLHNIDHLATTSTAGLQETSILVR